MNLRSSARTIYLSIEYFSFGYNSLHFVAFGVLNKKIAVVKLCMLLVSRVFPHKDCYTSKPTYFDTVQT